MAVDRDRRPEDQSPLRMWVLSELYYPEGSATGYYLTKIAEGLAQERPVAVLCAQPTYSARGTRAPWEEVHRGVSIRRCWGTTLDKDRLASRVLNLVSITLSVFWRALRVIRSGEPVLAVTNPPTLPFVAAIVSRVKRAPFVVLIHDVYPEVLVAAGLASEETPWIRLVGLAHRWLYRHATAIIVLGRDMRSLVQRRLAGPGPQIAIITNWADNETIAPGSREANALLNDLGLHSKFVIQYSGNMGRTHDLESLVEAARILAPEPVFHFLFIGSGAKEPWLRRTVAAWNLENVTVLPPRPRDELPISLNACDVSVISFLPKMSGVSVPSRMYNVLASGKPILAIADAESELALLVSEEEVGWVAPPRSPDRVVEAIRSARAHPAAVQAMGRRARSVAEQTYSYPSVMTKYNALFDAVSGPDRTGQNARRD